MFPAIARFLTLCSVLIVLVGCGGSSGLLSSLLGAPTISGVTPSPVAPGSSITITGVNLNGTLTTAYFTVNGSSVPSASATASSGNTTTVTVTVPNGLVASTYTIYVITSDSSGNQSVLSNSVTISVS